MSTHPNSCHAYEQSPHNTYDILTTQLPPTGNKQATEKASSTARNSARRALSTNQNRFSATTLATRSAARLMPAPAPAKDKQTHTFNQQAQAHLPRHRNPSQQAVFCCTQQTEIILLQHIHALSITNQRKRIVNALSSPQAKPGVLLRASTPLHPTSAPFTKHSQAP